MKERCENCHFWSGSTTPANRCRRYPPIVAKNYEQGQWPRTGDDDWCGEFRWVKDVLIVKVAP